MSKKLYEVRHIGNICNVEVNEITVVKETEKQLIIKGTCWTKLSKSDLECYIGSRDAVYSYDRDKAIKIYIAKIEEMKHDLLQRVEDVVQGLKKLNADKDVTPKKKGLKKHGRK
jgi:hypothetical protein